jgi:hypothetical protein
MEHSINLSPKEGELRGQSSSESEPKSESDLNPNPTLNTTNNNRLASLQSTSDSEEYFSDETAIIYDLVSTSSLDKSSPIIQEKFNKLAERQLEEQTAVNKTIYEPLPERRDKREKKTDAAQLDRALRDKMWLRMQEQELLILEMRQQLSEFRTEQQRKAEKKRTNVDLASSGSVSTQRKVDFATPGSDKDLHTPAPVKPSKPLPQNASSYSTPYKTQGAVHEPDAQEPFIETGLPETMKFPSGVSSMDIFHGEQGDTFAAWWTHFKFISAKWSNNMRVNVLLAKFGKTPQAWLMNVLRLPTTYSQLVNQIEDAYGTLNEDDEIRKAISALKWDSSKKSAKAWIAKIDALRLKLKEAIADKELIKILYRDCIPKKNAFYMKEADKHSSYLKFCKHLYKHEVKYQALIEEQRADAKRETEKKSQGRSQGDSKLPKTTLPKDLKDSKETKDGSTTPAKIEAAKDPNAHPDIECRYCHQKGHYRSDCPRRKQTNFLLADGESSGSSSSDEDSEDTIPGSSGSSVAIEPVDEQSTEPAILPASHRTQAMFGGDRDTDPTIPHRQVPEPLIPAAQAWMVDMIETDDVDGQPALFSNLQVIPTVTTNVMTPDLSVLNIVEIDNMDAKIEDIDETQLSSVLVKLPLLPSPIRDVKLEHTPKAKRERLLKVTPAETFVVIDQTPLKCLLDSGSNVSLITVAALEQLPVGSFEVMRSEPSFKVGKNETVKLLGSVLLPVTICAVELTMRFDIVESFPSYDVVLGMDEMLRNDLDLSIPRQLLFLPGGVPQVLNFGLGTSRKFPAISHVPGPYVNEQIIVPSSTTPISVRLPVVVPSNLFFRVVDPTCDDVFTLTSDVIQGNDTQFYTLDAFNPALKRVHLVNGVRVANIEVLENPFVPDKKGEEISTDPVVDARVNATVVTSTNTNSGAHSQSLDETNTETEQTPDWREKLSIGKINAEQRARLDLLLAANSHLFTKPKTWGANIRINHQVKLKPGTAPFKAAHRRVPPAHQKTLDEQIGEMLRQGIIRKSTSPWASPIVLVKKKDGTWRICVDFRELNLNTIKDASALPRMDASLDKLAKAKIMTAVDLRQGYHQVPLDEEDIEKTAFVVPSGHYEFV